MQKKIFVILLCFLIGFLPIVSYAQSSSYQYIMELGKRSLSRTFYEEAIHYFNIAHQVEPDLEEPLFFIDFAKRLKEGRVTRGVPIKEKTLKKFYKPEKKSDDVISKDTLIRDTLDIFESRSKDTFKNNDEFIRRLKIHEVLGLIETKKEMVGDKTTKKYLPVKVEVTKDAVIKTAETDYKKSDKRKISEHKESVDKPKSFQGQVVLGKGAKVIDTKGPFKAIKKLTLTDDLWDKQPIRIEMKIRNSIIIQGRNIKRFLIINPNIISGEKKDRNSVVIVSNVIKGSSFIHLWDDKGRWTLKFDVAFPSSAILKRTDSYTEGSAPFRLRYSANWQSFYSGENKDDLERSSITFYQFVKLLGDTPYGKFDASAGFTRFPDSKIVATTYGLGLTDAKIGPFKDFNIRGYDFYKYYSTLTLTGAGLRGAFIEGRILDDKLSYDFVWGEEYPIQERLSTGEVLVKDSVIEGVKITLFPSNRDNVSFNYVKGYGTAREDYLPDKVYSIQAQRYFGESNITSELAYDEDSVAMNIFSNWYMDNLKLRLNFRNIESNFSTIKNRPGGSGEIGTIFGVDYTFSDIRLSSDIDIYRDRKIFNVKNRQGVNFDWDTSLFIPLTPKSSWRTNIYYENSPQLVLSRKTLRLNNMYYNSFKFLKDRNFNWFLGNTYQRNRITLSPSSNYDRYAFNTGFRLSVIDNLYYYLNYEYSFLEDISSGYESFPRVLHTGINYSKRISKSLRSNLGISYRDEEGISGVNSFIAGEDSVSINFGLNYRPIPDVEAYINSYIRDTTSENSDVNSVDSFDVRFGIRTSFEFPLFAWNPKGEISGIVFNDLNGNTKRDDNEKGVPDIKIKVGKKEIVTDKFGRYSTKIRARRVVVAIDVESVTEGFVFSTSPSETLEIFHKGSYTVDFGITSQSGIYGVVYYDINSNGKPDEEDILVSNIKIILDNKDSTFTDTEGNYFFRNISSGKHLIKIDVTSLPLEYIPLIKVISQVELSEGSTSIFHIPLKKNP